jgi:glutathione synthase
MIVQPEENNIFDQRWIEQELCNKFGVKMIRATLASIKDIATLTTDKRLLIHGVETSVVYYRAGYTPTDYPSQIEWDARFFLETSFAIKCPNAAYHLVGAKKIQQVLANPTILQRYSFFSY